MGSEQICVHLGSEKSFSGVHPCEVPGANHVHATQQEVVQFLLSPQAPAQARKTSKTWGRPRAATPSH